MQQWVVVSIIIGAYLALTLTIGLLAGRKSSDSVTGYVAADRSFGLLVMYFVTGASVFSAFAFLGGPGWAYSRGAAGILHPRLRCTRDGTVLLDRTEGSSAGA